MTARDDALQRRAEEPLDVPRASAALRRPPRRRAGTPCRERTEAPPTFEMSAAATALSTASANRRPAGVRTPPASALHVGAVIGVADRGVELGELVLALVDQFRLALDEAPQRRAVDGRVVHRRLNARRWPGVHRRVPQSEQFVVGTQQRDQPCMS